MARSFLTAINLNKNELQNAAVQNLGTAPASPVKGQLYFNSTGGDNTLYWWDGTSWVPAKASGGAFPGYGSVPAETTFGIAKSDGAATTVARSDHTHGSPTHDDAAHSAVHLNALAAPNGVVSMGGMQMTNLGSPVAGTDAVNKNYVDNYVAGLSWKAPVRAIATSMVPLTGTQTVDGVALVAGDRMLAQNQGNTGNGIYVVAAGPWNRATDADTGTELLNAAVFVSEGTTYKDTAWVCTNDAPIVIGTTTPTFVQFAGGGTVTAGAGLTQSGNTLNVVAANGSIVVGADDVQVGFLAAGGGGPGGPNGSAVTAARSDHFHPNIAKVYQVSTVAGTTSTAPHNFNSRNVVVTIYRNSAPYEDVDADIERTDANTVTVRFASAVALGEYSILVIGY